MNPVALAALKLGLISPAMRAQFAQWGEVPEVEPVELQDHGDVTEMIERALQSDDLALPKVTHLELVQQFCATQRLGKLHLTLNEQSVSFDVVFGMTRAGDVILPWRSEDIREVMLDPKSTFLHWIDGAEHVARFRTVEEIYYGDVKAFMVCTPTKEPERHDAS